MKELVTRAATADETCGVLRDLQQRLVHLGMAVLGGPWPCFQAHLPVMDIVVVVVVWVRLSAPVLLAQQPPLLLQLLALMS